jgi:outer membrane receptor protein involved in Fe transport
VIGQVPDRSDGFPFINPDYHLINLRAGYATSNNLELTVFVNNAFDEEYYAGAGENFGLSGFRLRPHPRYVGVSVSYTFGEI